jgi:threonine/homoserine efflux transporter RhtA
MGHEQRPPYVLALAVLVVGFVVGIAFAGLSVNDVLVGLALLAGMVTLLYIVVGKREGVDRSDADDHHTTAAGR